MYRDLYREMDEQNTKAAKLIAAFGGIPDTDIVFRPTERYEDTDKSTPFNDPPRKGRYYEI